jgi:hypothetical protein
MQPDYIGEIIKQAVELRRLENGLASEISKEFDSAFTGPLQILDDLDNAQTRRAVVMNFQDKFATVTRELYETVNKLQTNSSILIAEKQSDRTAKAMLTAFGKNASIPHTLGKQRLREILDNDAIDGLTVDEWHKRNEASLQRRIRIQTNVGLQNNETLSQIKDRVEKFAIAPAKRHAETLARTSAQNLSNAAIWETGEANPQLTRGYRLLVTFDSRTSQICIANGARNLVYPYQPSSPRPPFHWLCRTIIKPVIVGREEEKPEDAGEWLKRQDEQTQSEILGARRAELFRKGKLDLADLIRGDNSIKTLPELRGVAATFAPDDAGAPIAGSSEPSAKVIKVRTAEQARARIERIHNAIKSRITSIDVQIKPVNDEISVFLAKGASIPDELSLRYKNLQTQRIEVFNRRLELMRRSLYVQNPAKFEAKIAGKFDGKRKSSIDEGVGFFKNIVGRQLPDNASVNIKPGGRGRSNYDQKGNINFATGRTAKTVIHELGHWLEDIDPEAHKKVLEFYDRRTANEPLLRLGRPYARHEKTRRDKFLDPYMGKEYKDLRGNRYGTEIVSMGVEYLYANPFKLAMEDADYFDFLFDLIRGY